MLNPKLFYNQVQNIRLSTVLTDKEKVDQLIELVQSIVSDTTALLKHISFIEEEIQSENKLFFYEFQKVLKIIRDRFVFSDRLLRAIPRGLNSFTCIELASILVTVYTERIEEVRSKKASKSSSGFFWGQPNNEEKTKELASVQPSDESSANTSRNEIEVQSETEKNTEMAQIVKAEFKGIKLIEPKEDQLFRQFNLKFQKLMLMHDVPLKASLDDNKKEDPKIIEAYVFTLSDKDEWLNAVTQAKDSNEGKNADLVSLMKMAENILEPTHKSLMCLLQKLTSLKQTYGSEKSSQSCRKLYKEITDVKELPCIKNFSVDTFLNFLLLESSGFKNEIVGLVDIEKDSLQSIQEKIDKQSATSEHDHAEELAVNAVRHRDRHSNFRERKWRNNADQREKFCLFHGDNTTHQTNDCLTIQGMLKKQDEKSIQAVKAIQKKAPDTNDEESSEDSSEYDKFLNIHDSF